ncbi:hypothetical protein MSG28_008944 [Choristoneura fumiferana]|uniref:Uncharacterized protein n=1 Tax=Choristoneura fumiferana TaxID=7141 RepID=A0ACC0J8L1_CHOFU|nr:hypothetical protein MSG28_008944 [Choristoneura fumiferana]
MGVKELDGVMQYVFYVVVLEVCFVCRWWGERGLCVGTGTRGMALLFGALGVLALVSHTGCTGNANGLNADGVQELDYTDVDLGLTQRGPHFDVAYSRNVTALVGKTAQLNCVMDSASRHSLVNLREDDVHL